MLQKTLRIMFWLFQVALVALEFVFVISAGTAALNAFEWGAAWYLFALESLLFLFYAAGNGNWTVLLKQVVGISLVGGIFLAVLMIFGNTQSIDLGLALTSGLKTTVACLPISTVTMGLLMLTRGGEF